MIRFLVDECVDRRVVQALADDGHDMALIPHTLLSQPDTDIAAHAAETGRVVLTLDHDFGELAVRHRVEIPGVVLLVCQSLPMEERIARVVEAIRAAEAGIPGALINISATRVRRRAL